MGSVGTRPERDKFIARFRVQQVSSDAEQWKAAQTAGPGDAEYNGDGMSAEDEAERTIGRHLMAAPV